MLLIIGTCISKLVYDAFRKEKKKSTKENVARPVPMDTEQDWNGWCCCVWVISSSLQCYYTFIECFCSPYLYDVAFS